jgi:hypothetical protein
MTTKQNIVNRHWMGALRHERGAALVMSLVLLLILTVMGIGAMLTSSTEFSLSGNYMISKEAYYAADGGMAYAIRDGQYYNVNLDGTGGGPFPAVGVDLAYDGTDASGDILLLTAHQDPPEGLGFGTGFDANYFIVEAEGTARQSAASRQTVIKAEIVVAQ